VPGDDLPRDGSEDLLALPAAGGWTDVRPRPGGESRARRPAGARGRPSQLLSRAPMPATGTVLELVNEVADREVDLGAVHAAVVRLLLRYGRAHRERPAS